jgi:C-8 sterol isomerase
MRTYTEDNVLVPVVTRPGERALLRRDQTKGYKISDGTWMLEYARGPVPTALPLALCDGLISCMDGYTVAKTLTVYGRHVVRELLKGKV